MGKEWNGYYRGNRWLGKRIGRWAPMGAYEFSVLTRTARLRMSGLPFRGVFLRLVDTRETFPWAPFLASPGARWRPSVKKIKLADRATVKHLAPLESEYLRDHMPVVEALAMLQYDDASPRQPGYMGVWTQGSTWFCRLTDKDADATLTAEGRTLDEALDTLSVLLGSDNAPWEPNSRRKGKKG